MKLVMMLLVMPISAAALACDPPLADYATGPTAPALYADYTAGDGWQWAHGDLRPNWTADTPLFHETLSSMPNSSATYPDSVTYLYDGVYGFSGNVLTPDGPVAVDRGRLGLIVQVIGATTSYPEKSGSVLFKVSQNADASYTLVSDFCDWGWWDVAPATITVLQVCIASGGCP